MRLGIDFGTTRIVAAAADRGNYPVIRFDDPNGEPVEWFPALVAVKQEHCLFGWRAWQAQDDSAATVVRSIKRHMAEAGPQTRIQIGGAGFTMIEVLAGLCSEFRVALAGQSTLKLAPSEKLEVLLGVPANANGNQRFLTAEAFRLAGFHVLGLLNEPSAASIEFGHGGARAGRKEMILVYDLGGGTFDASLVEIGENRHEVLATEGIASLGGDDFDGVLGEMALEAASLGPEREGLTQAEWFHLHEECRQKKESLHPNTRRISIDLGQAREGWPPVEVGCADYYKRCQPLIDETIHATSDLLAGREGEIEALYVTGGASELPQVSRALRETFGRRVKRSSYARSATAIGLAIQAGAAAGYVLRDQFTRNFGVWREAEGGRRIIFDPLFAKGTLLPLAGESPLEVRRRYYPAHNIGHFRYLECSHTAEDGRPAGEIAFWDEIQYPFDPSLRRRAQPGTAVRRMDWVSPPEVEERYTCDASGAVTVTIADLRDGFECSYRLGRWSAAAGVVEPGKPRRKSNTKKAAG